MVLTDTLRSFGKVRGRVYGHWHQGPRDSVSGPAMIQRVRRLPHTAAWPVHPGGKVPGWAVASAALSPVLLTAGWLVAGALQPASYDPIRKTVSVLAGHAGTDRWIMTGTLFVVGGCHLVTAAGLTGVRVPARVLLIVAGMASIGIAASPEPVVGSTPQHLAWTALAERLSSSVQTSWPFIVAVTLRRSTSWTRPRRPAGPLTDGRLTDGPWPDGPTVPTGAPPGPWGPG
jgi:hypothetical protein